MDRATVYAGQIPREVDILNTGRFGMIGVGMLAGATLGTGIAVAGFAMRPTAPASLIANVSAGQVYQVANIDATAWSSLAADTRSIVKQGILLDDFPLTFAPPTTPGYSQSFLVEVQYQDGDTDQKVLPYYNAANPSQGFAGPGGSGAAQNTNRRGVAAIQVKAGVSATAGSQQAPAPDAGWAPLFIVTLSAGQTTITAGNIVTHPSAPFVPATLMQVPSAVQSGKWQYAVATGTNTLRASLSPAPDALVDGLTFRIACPTANTDAVSLALNGFDACFVVRKDGSPLRAGDIAAGEVVNLTYKGGVFGFVVPARSEIVKQIPAAAIVHQGENTGTANAIVATVAPDIAAYDRRAVYVITVSAANTGPVTANLSGLGVKPVVRSNGNPLRPGDISRIAMLSYDGTNLVLLNLAQEIAPPGSGFAGSKGRFGYVPNPGETSVLSATFTASFAGLLVCYSTVNSSFQNPSISNGAVVQVNGVDNAGAADRISGASTSVAIAKVSAGDVISPLSIAIADPSQTYSFGVSQYLNYLFVPA